MGISFWIGLILVIHTEEIHGLKFTKNPANLTITQGNMARLGCAIEGMSEPEVSWMKDGEKLYSTDQMYITIDTHHWETFYSVKSVQQQDAGKYWCEVDYQGKVISSESAWITVEGVPHFLVEPQDVATFAGDPFNLTCAAVGPPDPVQVLWWLGGEPKGDFRPSPSVLLVEGVKESTKFYCEAKNARGISVSRTGTVYIKELPDPPKNIHIDQESGNVTIMWSPGFNGHSDLLTCSIQINSKIKGKLPDLQVTVPPFQYTFGGLKSYSNYSLRIMCENEVGPSPFSLWMDFQTPEAGVYITIDKMNC